MAVIQETYAISGANTDLLAAPSRLAAIPFNGVLRLEISATVSNASNNFTLTIQLPGGANVVDAQQVPANGYSTSDEVIHRDTKMVYEFQAPQGGHFTIAFAETGTATAFIIATLRSR